VEVEVEVEVQLDQEVREEALQALQALEALEAVEAVEALQALAALQAEALRPHQRSNTLATGKHTRPNAKMGDPLNLLCDST